MKVGDTVRIILVPEDGSKDDRLGRICKVMRDGGTGDYTRAGLGVNEQRWHLRLVTDPPVQGLFSPTMEFAAPEPALELLAPAPAKALDKRRRVR